MLFCIARPWPIMLKFLPMHYTFEHTRIVKKITHNYCLKFLNE